MRVLNDHSLSETTIKPDLTSFFFFFSGCWDFKSHDCKETGIGPLNKLSLVWISWLAKP